MNRKSLILSLTLVMLLLVPSWFAIEQKAGGTPSGSTENNMLTVRLSGTPRDMGSRYGLEVRNEIRKNLNTFWATESLQGMSRSELLSKASDLTLPSSMTEELNAVSAAAGVGYADLLAFNEFGPSASHQACTILSARGDATLDGNPICSKTSDVYGYDQVLLIVNPSHGYAHMEVAYAGGVYGPEDGMNVQGLATGFNWLNVPATYDPGLPTWVIEELILQNCSSVQQAIDLVRPLPKQIGGNIMVSDREETVNIEIAPSLYTPNMSYEITTSGIVAHTNYWMFEPFLGWILNQTNGWTLQKHMYIWIPAVARYDRAMDLGAHYDGRLNASLLMSFTRDLTNWGDSPNAVIAAHPDWAPLLKGGWPGNSICNAATRSACVFETDMKNPTMLSTMWMALGNPCYSPFVPLDTAILYSSATVGYATTQLSSYETRQASQLSDTLKDKCTWGQLVPGYVSWEAGIIKQTAANQQQALLLMKKGDYSKAANILTTADCGIALQALGLQSQLAAKHGH